MGETHLITNDQEALEIADRFARQIEAESTNRDKDRRLPFHEMELFSESGLLGMTVPKSYGGPGVSTVTFVQAVALISSADASLGQIPQNHYANIEEIRLVRVTNDQILHSFEAYKKPTTRGPFSQIIHVAIDVGIAQAALKETAHFLRTYSALLERLQAQAAAEDPLTINEFGELQCRLHAAEALMERAAEAIDEANASQGYESVSSAAIAVAEAKVASTEVAMAATNQLFELVGPESLREKYGLDRHWRNARVHTLHDPVRWKYHAIGNFYLNGVDPPRHAWI